MRLDNVYDVYLFSNIGITAALKKYPFILLDRSDFHIIDILSIAVNHFAWSI